MLEGLLCLLAGVLPTIAVHVLLPSLHRGHLTDEWPDDPDRAAGAPLARMAQASAEDHHGQHRSASI